jgi:uncharacterized protein (DUF2384 family)
MYLEFKDLPAGIQKKIEFVIGKDVEDWVHKPIPALRGKSIMEMINSENGEREIRLYLQRVESDSH